MNWFFIIFLYSCVQIHLTQDFDDNAMAFTCYMPPFRLKLAEVGIPEWGISFRRFEDASKSCDSNLNCCIISKCLGGYDIPYLLSEGYFLD